uniref:Uncharacterized protein n=1 Tax=Anguilla anguilla TaxID=7936 RepID=A0A0E9PVE9_ANGAN
MRPGFNPAVKCRGVVPNFKWKHRPNCSLALHHSLFFYVTV